MKNYLYILISVIAIHLTFSCSNDNIISNGKNTVCDTIAVYDTIEVNYQNLYNCAQINPIKTFGLYVNIEVPMEIYVEGIPDSLLEITTNNGTIIKHGNFYKIKTEKAGVSIITISKNGEKITRRQFSAIQLPKPTPRLGNFTGKEISKNTLLSIPGLWAKMPYYCDYYRASIDSFSIVVYKDGIEKKLKSENSRFTEEQIDLFKELKSGQNIYFEDIFATTPDSFKHELEIIKITLK